MPSLIENIMGSLGGDALGKLSASLGSDEKTTGAATGAAVTAILGALSKNASTPSGAEALAGALSRDHDGSIMNNLQGFLGQAQQGPGEGILKHVLGNRRPAIEQTLSKTTGMDQGSIGKLLAMVAPVVLGTLGKTQRQQGLDSSALAGLLGQERQSLAKAQPGAMSALAGLLDADGDGDVDMSDIASKGMGMLGSFFKK